MDVYDSYATCQMALDLLSYSVMGHGYYWHIAVLAGQQDAII